ncbi:MAG: tRNA guanosine(34) transglycosylase Tgt [Microscillaceae bacterium]|nr:tRNA guanosine(34) transglycosylase Tgt [Microscillaceae bacterium]MDW8460358.1 tRNA guanosine(34) transglycosylase Tgt [Cytophagales bacterium]
MRFEIKARDATTQARVGKIYTERGEIDTPIFMPVGTAGTVKAVHQRELEQDIQAQIILGNTYHLYLRPGLEILRKLGGLHGFNHWNRPILTDSGGYQVYSLAGIRKITEEGVKFQSHIDGSRHVFTPENVINTQRVIGADIIMAFDECPPYPCEYSYAERSMHLTHRWLERCIRQFEQTEPLYGKEQVLFPIVQGSIYKDLRKQSAEFVALQDCAGNAIGGLAVGEPVEQMYETIALVNEILPQEKPRYLMGVGTPANILESIALGVDMFDCVMPTRNARNGTLFTTQGIINIKNKKWEADGSPIDEQLGGYASTYYSKAYLRHLIISREILGAQIATLHNLRFYLWLVSEARKQIQNQTFSQWKATILPIITQKI